MKKKKKRGPKIQQVYGINERALRELANMKHRDVQKACVIRGLDFLSVVKYDHHKLIGWFQDNYDNGQDLNKLVEFDAWRTIELTTTFGDKIESWQLHPALNYGYTGEIDKLDRPKAITKLTEVKSEKKQKATIDEATGVRSGTKKAMTYKMTQAGGKIEDIIKAVLLAFPGAQEKSIKIWAKRALKEMAEKK